MTPIRNQYLEIKRKYPDTIVLFRLGDFYEAFDDDAALCARELNLTLTSRPLGKATRVPMAGIPHHALAGYLRRLIGGGHRVAICDQVGEVGTGRGLVERAVTRVLSPGTVLTEDLLDGVANNYLAAVTTDGQDAGIARVDVSTMEFVATQVALDAVAAELDRISPAELLLCDDQPVPDGWQGPLSRVAGATDPARVLREHFGTATLEPFGCAELPHAIAAAAMLITYITGTQPHLLGLLDRLSVDQREEHMLLDRQTRRNLEIFQSARGADRDGSLLAVIDRTRTSMGARLLRGHLAQPLRDICAIEARLALVDVFVGDAMLRAEVRVLLADVSDLERLVARAGVGQASPRDLWLLRRGLDRATALRQVLSAHAGPLPLVPDCSAVAALIGAALADAPPSALEAGGAIRDGYHADLDEHRSLARDARQVLATYEQQQRVVTGIRSLRVTHNRVLGYFIEVSGAQLSRVPEHYQRRQSVSNAERFVTAELKELEARIAGAQERVQALEAELFRDLCAQVVAHATEIKALATVIARLDVAASHAEVASVSGYCRPSLADDDLLDIRDGRHPVVELGIPPGAFVANDSVLCGERQIVIVTGPNMAGKSTYLRQVALIVLLAQSGSYVPASSAHIGVVDRIFTRVGAQDDLAAGNSTFMVEMIETAQILHGATVRSLLILDEVGRGTSTYDGLAIAQAIVEYLHNRPAVAARTLFATHYHELTALVRTLPRVTNASVAVIELDGEVVFLRRIVPGGADRSYGIHVAQLAGLPRPLVQRAREILDTLEQARTAPRRRTSGRGAPDGLQLGLFAQRPELLEDLAQLDVDALTPLEALTKLYDLRERARATT